MGHRRRRRAGDVVQEADELQLGGRLREADGLRLWRRRALGTLSPLHQCILSLTPLSDHQQDRHLRAELGAALHSTNRPSCSTLASERPTSMHGG